MPLRKGSSDKVIQENINCILKKEGCGYDPPYKDPAREEYTPAQAAAIAYAKAGRRNNTGNKSTSSSKKTKSVKTSNLKTPKGKEEQKDKSPQTPAQSDNTNVKEKDTKSSSPQVPEGWKVKQPKGDADSQSPPSQEGSKISPEEDKKMLQETLQGYKNKWGDGESLVGDSWKDLTDKQKQQYHKEALKYLKQDNKSTPESKPEPESDPGDQLLKDNADILSKAFPDIDNWKEFWPTLKDSTKQTLINTAKKLANRPQKQEPEPEQSQEPQNEDKGNSNKTQINFDLADDTVKFSKYNFAKSVSEVNNQLKNTVADDYGDPKPLMALSDDEKYAFREYSGSLYGPLNRLLRGTDTGSDKNTEFLNQIKDVMDQGLASLPDSEEGVYWRMNGIKQNRTNMIEAIKNLEPGDTYIENGYASFTGDQDGNVLDTFYHSNKFSFVFKYQGKKMKNIAPLSKYVEEHEYLTQRGQKFKILKKEVVPMSTWDGLSGYDGTILMFTLGDA